MSESKTIFITGASSGLGKAATQLFQAKGWRVAATMRRPEKETELASLEGVKLFALDVCDPKQIDDVAQQAIESFGSIDVVFNNAGYGLAGPFEGADDDRITRQIQTNLLGVLRTTKAFLPHLRDRKQGLIINTTSIGGLITLPFNSVYHATKWALEGWSESMWFELKPLGIGIKTVSPGGIATDFAGRSLDLVQHPAYADSLATAMKAFQSRTDTYSTAMQIAEVVYEAATDGKSQLRYVAGADAKAMYAQRQSLGDQGFMEALRTQFFEDP